MRVVSLLFVLASLLGASLGGKECSHCVEQWLQCLKEDCASAYDPGVVVLPRSCEWDCKARRRRCFDECLKGRRKEGGWTQGEKSFIIKPATMPSFEGEGDAELLVHVSPDVWAKGEYQSTFAYRSLKGLQPIASAACTCWQCVAVCQ